MAEELRFQYAALDAKGRRSSGRIVASGADAALDALEARGLKPIRVRPVVANAITRGGGPGERHISAFVADLAALLRAGADIRGALNLLSQQSPHPGLQSMARQVVADISGGAPISEAFVRHLPARYAYVGALVMAGEASGDLPGSLERAAEMLESRLKVRDQLISILSYPAFVLVSAVVGLSIILLFVVPPLAPLANAPGAHPGLAMRSLLAASTGLRLALPYLAIAAIVSALAFAAAVFTGIWKPIADRLLLSGPAGAYVRGIVYGSFAVALGGMIDAGAPIVEAVKLALQTLKSTAAQKELRHLGPKIRSGQPLSAALSTVPGMPRAIVRLTLIGQESGSLGSMLVRAGTFEEQAAYRRIEAAGRFLGPCLILILGAFIGTLMAGLLTGVSGLGDTALGQ